MPIRKRFAPPRQRPRLTPTQRAILVAVRESGSPLLCVGRAHRNGTSTQRGVSADGRECTIIHAYGNPEYFIRQRGWIVPTGELYMFELTDLGCWVAKNA